MVLLATSFVVLSAVFANAQGLQVDTPAAAVTCEPVLIHFGGGVPPYYLSFIPAGQPGAAAVKQFPATSDSGITWNVDLPSGSVISLMVRDSTGNVAYSDKVTIQNGPETSCAAASASAIPALSAPAASASQSGASSASPSASSAPPAAVPPPAAAATTGANAHPASQPAETAHPSGSSSQNVAVGNHENLGIMGAMALVVAAAFAFH